MAKSRRRFMVRIAAVLLTVCILGAAASPVTQADDLSDLQNTYDTLQKQHQQLEAQIKQKTSAQQSAQAKQTAIDKDISLVKQQISTLNAQVTALNAQIDQKQQEITSKQKDIDNTYSLYKQRLRAMYEAGNVSYIELLLTSGGITDFLNNIETLKVVSKHDNQLLTQLRTDKKAIEDSKKTIESNKASVEASKNNLVTKQNELNVQEAQQQQLVQDIAAAKADLQTQKSLNEDDIKQASAELQQYISQHASKSGSANIIIGNGFFLWPIKKGQYTMGYGFGGYVGHTGQDILASYGTPIYAAASGTVILAAQQNTSYGNHLIIDHGNGILTLYAHCSKLEVGLGQQVNKGDEIALVGSTGNSTGNHLHFEVRLNNGSSSTGQPVNPLNYTYSFAQ